MNGHWQTMNLGRIMGLPSSVIQIAATDASFFALLDNGDVWCCGNNDSGQLGYLQMTGTATTPILLKHPNLANVKRIACGKDFVYFLLHDGTVRNCGNNANNQLGRLAPSGTSVMPNLGLFPLSGVKAIACGNSTTYIQIGENQVWTCGNNSVSQCGFSNSSSTVDVPLLAYTAPVPIREITCGTRHGLIVLSDGRLLATGYPGSQYAYPMTSNGSQAFTEAVSTSGLVTGIDRAIAANDYSLFLRNGLPWVCGYNAQGQLAPGVTASPIMYQQSVISAGLPLNDVFTRERSSFWIQPDGRVFALGDNTFGQLGCPSAVQIGGYGTIGFH